MDPRSPTILAVEDNELTLRTLVGMLKSRGYETLEARNGKEAVATALDEKPDLILMDVQMPIMTGFEAISEIRKTDLGQTVPIILLSGIQLDQNELAERTKGANHFLPKPVATDLLFDSIEDCLSTKGAA